MESISFKISGLPMGPFSGLFDLSDEELTTMKARRCIADMKPGFPCRVSLVEAEIGETVLLIPFKHHEVDSPYSSSGPIYIRENAKPAEMDVNEIPEVLKTRLISIRAYSSDSMMIASSVAEGKAVERQILEFFADSSIAYLHLHNAKPGCFSCRVDRA